MAGMKIRIEVADPGGGKRIVEREHPFEHDDPDDWHEFWRHLGIELAAASDAISEGTAKDYILPSFVEFLEEQ